MSIKDERDLLRSALERLVSNTPYFKDRSTKWPDWEATLVNASVALRVTKAKPR